MATKRERNKSRLQVSGMRYLRAAVELTRQESVRSKVIHEQCGMRPMLGRLGEKQLSWFGHMVRMSDEREVKCIWKMGID